VFCALLLPLSLRATSTITPDDFRAPSATALPDHDAATPIPKPAVSFLPGETPHPAQPSATAAEAAQVFVADVEPEQEPPPEPPEPTPDPDQWFYDDDDISIKIVKKSTEKFVYFEADVRLTRPEQFWYAFSHERFGASAEPLSDIARRHNPLLAINGDYYGFHSHGIIIRGGELFRRNNSARHLLIVDSNGDLRVMTDRSEKQGAVANRLAGEGVLHTFEFGPVLVNNGEKVRLRSEILRVAEGYREPRTAIGQLGPLRYLVIVVDGRSPGYSEGCDLPTLQSLFLEHDVSVAFNLDGGGSTTLWFNGEVINKPSAGDERSVSDIVMFIR